MVKAGNKYYIVRANKAEEFMKDYRRIAEQKLEISDERFRQGVLFGMELAIESLLEIKIEHPQDLSPLDAHENTHK